MIYFDNAATGGNKPKRVIESAENAIRYMCVNAGHSGHKRAVLADEFVYKTRKALQKFFNAERCERIIFTKNCTEALNVALFGAIEKGCNVVTSVYEHNSVLRPLYKLRDERGISLTFIRPKAGALLLSDVEDAITEKTRAVCLTGASNVTGEITDYEAIGQFLSKKNILFILDGAQICGHTFIDLKAAKIDVLCFSGHKGMHGIQGSGGLVFNKKTHIEPLLFGGTGTESFAALPSDYPELLECGTLNLPAIVSLAEGTLYNSENLRHKQKRLLALTSYAIEKLSEIKQIRLYSKRNPLGIVSFSYGEYASQEVAGILSDRYDIATRGGYHCAPLCHSFLNTEVNGLVRLSFSEFNNEDEIDALISALRGLPAYIVD